MSGVIILIVEGHGQGEIIRFNWFPWTMCLGVGHVPKLTNTSVSRYIYRSHCIHYVKVFFSFSAAYWLTE